MSQESDTKKEARLAWGSGRIAFLAHKEKIHQMIAAGHPQRHVFNQLENELGGLSYSQFSHYVRNSMPKTSISKKKDVEPVAEKPHEKEEGHLEKPEIRSRSTQPVRYKPGPRIPDPSQLY